jgi:hypothetical protein
MLTDVVAARQSSVSFTHDLRFPRRRSYYRNHGYGKVEEDAAVGANWYVKAFPRYLRP